MAKQSKNGRSTSSPADKFVALRAGLRQSEAWLSLSPPARCVLIEMMAGVYQANNGSVARSIRFLANVTAVSKGAVERAVHDLQDRGFIIRTGGGYLGPDGQGKASLWRITEYGTQADPIPTKEYASWRRPKSKTPSHEKGQGVPRERTVCAGSVPSEGTGCPTRRDSLACSEGVKCPTSRDKSNLPGNSRWGAQACPPTMGHVSAPVNPASHFSGEPRRFAIVLPSGAVRRVGVRSTILSNSGPATSAIDAALHPAAINWGAA